MVIRAKEKIKQGKKDGEGIKAREGRQAMWLSKERHSEQREQQEQTSRGRQMLIMFKKELADQCSQNRVKEEEEQQMRLERSRGWNFLEEYLSKTFLDRQDRNRWKWEVISGNQKKGKQKTRNRVEDVYESEARLRVYVTVRKHECEGR